MPQTGLETARTLHLRHFLSELSGLSEDGRFGHSATPFEARQAQLKLVDKLLERELERMKHPVRREKPEEWKKEPVEQG